MTYPTRVARRGRPQHIRRDRPTAIPAIAVALAVLLAPALLLAAAGAALGAGPRLVNGVTDEAQALGAGEEQAIDASLQSLRADHGIQLFVAFVETTDPDPVTDYTAALAAQNSLGGNDALLVVAVGDRSDALWVGDSLDAVTTDEIDSILVDALEPRLADGDFAGAVIAAVQALGDASSSAPTAAPTVAPTVAATASPAGPGDGDGGSGSRGGLDLTAIVAILVVGVGAFLIVRSLLRRRSAATAATAAGAQLNREANRQLLATDEALKDAANDVEFAAAQWGDAEVVSYREAIRQAGDELRAAFSLRQRLDDAQPDTPPERDAMLREILSRTTAASQLLDTQEARFDQLEDLARTAPEQLVAAGQAIAALQGRRAAAGVTLGWLTGAYAPSAVASVAGNLEEVDKALLGAAAETDRGRSIQDTKRNEAVLALRRVQDGLARATRLVDAVERLATELDTAAAALPGELAAARADVEAARSAVQQADPASVDPGAEAALRAAEQALGEALRAAEAKPLDPLAAMRRATAANQAADAIVAGIRAAEEQARRRTAMATTAVASARGHVTRALDYVITRRHAVGPEARTRVAEAELQLANAAALAATDPDGATAAANRAAHLADEAYRLAAAEFEAWDAARGGGTPGGSARGGWNGPAGGTTGGDILGAVLGGIIGGALSSGRGGWGGTPWGGSGGGRSGGGGFGGFGGFGGGGGGGGGGRVRGGRW